MFIGLTEIAGGASQLCLGFRALGYHCDFFTKYFSRFEYQEPTKSFLMRLVRLSLDKWAKAWTARKEIYRLFWKAVTRFLLLLLFIRCLVKYDIFIFFFNETFSRRQWELPVLKFFGKKTVFIYCGTDSRPPYLNGKNIDLADTPEGISQLATMTRLQKQKLLRVEKYADFIHNDLSPDFIAPTLFVHPDKVEEAAEKLINNPDFRLALGGRAKQYAEKNYQASEVARKILRLIDGTAPDEWLCDPYEIKYLMGAGATESGIRKMLKSLIDRYGPDILQLDDKPLQREALLRFMKEADE